MKDELMQFLINFTWDHHIGLDIGPYKADFKSCSIPENNLVIINTNWKDQDEVPFSFAHELGHIMNGDTGIRYYDSGTINSKSEYHANKYGIQLLLKFCEAHNIEFDNPVSFCEHFGVPMKLDYIASLLF